MNLPASITAPTAAPDRSARAVRALGGGPRHEIKEAGQFHDTLGALLGGTGTGAARLPSDGEAAQASGKSLPGGKDLPAATSQPQDDGCSNPATLAAQAQPHNPAIAQHDFLLAANAAGPENEAAAQATPLPPAAASPEFVAARPGAAAPAPARPAGSAAAMPRPGGPETPFAAPTQNAAIARTTADQPRARKEGTGASVLVGGAGRQGVAHGAPVAAERPRAHRESEHQPVPVAPRSRLAGANIPPPAIAPDMVPAFPVTLAEGGASPHAAIANPAPWAGAAPASSPATAPGPLEAARVEQLIDSLVDARESGRTARGEMNLRHGEFGAISLTLEQGESQLRATLSSRDPGFAPAAQAALAERAIASQQDNAATSPRSAGDGASAHGAPRDGGAQAGHGDARGSAGHARAQPGHPGRPGADEAAQAPVSADPAAAADHAIHAGARFA